MTLICGTGIDMSKALPIEALRRAGAVDGTYKIVFFMGLPARKAPLPCGSAQTALKKHGASAFPPRPPRFLSLDILADMKDIKDRLGDSGDNSCMRGPAAC